MEVAHHTVGVLGASGYSGEVLLEILSHHPAVERLVVVSRSHAGERVDTVMPRLAGSVGDLVFTAAKVDDLPALEVDVWFLALPHGVASRFALPLQAAGRIVIDLSADFRLFDADLYQRYYGEEHPAAEWLNRVPYVLPELSSGWERQRLLACPGCYPSSVLFPLIPLFRVGLLPPRGIVINACSGVSGAGKRESFFYSFCERSESMVAYGLVKHRHLAEIEEQLSIAAGDEVVVQFTPHLVPMVRGIATTITVPCSCPVESVYAEWEKVYRGCRGIRLLQPGTAPDTRWVIGRNRVDMSAIRDSRTGNLIITSAVDNLMKGAGGQAVQIMNRVLGLDEFCGLR